MAASKSPAITPAGTSQSLAPAPMPISIKPSASTAGSPSPSTPVPITTKEWIIPPRPKPGRKPATDTPPTKRKAQNRAAQRAFRERRAARVGELEEQIKKIEDEHDVEQAELTEHISKLDTDLQQLRNEVEWWQAKCSKLEKELEFERSKDTPSDAVPLPPRRSHIHKSAEPDPTGCGNCTSTSRCECVEQAFEIANLTDISIPKRAQSPQQGSNPKRCRSNVTIDIKPEPDDLETDFTAQFSTKSAPPVDTSPTTVPDPCGFCQNGTPCICAEMAAEQPPNEPNEPSSGVGLADLSQFTPPPSDGDVLPSTTAPPLTASGPCTSGPGSCAQCRSDPNSTIFCKTLAASRSPSTSCNGAINGSCCQTRSVTASANASQSSGSDSSTLRLSCADAYTTLSRHKGYVRATDEMGTWLPKLHTFPAVQNPREQIGTTGSGSSEESDLNVVSRPAMDIEAASVMGVLKYFDRRFGKGN